MNFEIILFYLKKVYIGKHYWLKGQRKGETPLQPLDTKDTGIKCVTLTWLIIYIKNIDI